MTALYLHTTLLFGAPLVALPMDCAGHGDPAGVTASEPASAQSGSGATGRLESATFLNQVSAAEIASAIVAAGGKAPAVTPCYDVALFNDARAPSNHAVASEAAVILASR